MRIKDIAKMAGVSEGTVDRVLHNRGNVSEEALIKVKSVLNKIDYKPNLIARSLVKGKNVRVSVLIPEPKSDAYWVEVNSGITQAKTEWESYKVKIEPFFYVHDGKSSMELVAKQVLKADPAGVVIAPIFYPQALYVFKQFQKNGIPYVLFNTNIPESKPLSFIGQDLFQSGRLAAQLMSLGNNGVESIIILHIGEDIKDSIYLIEKENGFREFYSRKVTHKHTIKSVNINSSEKIVAQQIDTVIKDKNITGIFVSTSKAIALVASALQKANRNDITLIGYDMLDDNLKFLKMGIINFLINQNPKRQAFVGISHMVNHLLFKKDVPGTELFPLEVITQENVESYIASGIH